MKKASPVLVLFLLLSQSLWAAESAPNTSTSSQPATATFPELKKFVFEEPHSNYYMGFSIAPIGIMSGRMFYGAGLFQVNYQGKKIDWEIFNATVGVSSAQNTLASSKQFIFRTAPKYRVSKNISLGALVGLQFLEFSNIQYKIEKNINGVIKTPDIPETFNASGLIYGAVASEYFSLSSGYKLRISQIYYVENYSVTDAGNGWVNNFTYDGGSFDTSIIKPSSVVMLELALLF